VRNFLLWDFDGVIVDSMDECLLTSYKAFLKFRGKQDAQIKRLDNIPASIRDEFKRTRQYVRGAGEYVILHEAMLGNEQIKNYDGFNVMLNRFSEIVPEYHKIFYATREELRRTDPGYWMDLHSVYPCVQDKWSSLKEHFEFYVVSNKDSDSIRLILQKNKLQLGQGKIYGMDFSLSKETIIKHILSISGAQAKDVSFLDDNYYHLLDVSGLGIALYFATWGYGKISRNKNQNIVIVNAETFDKKLVEDHENAIC